MGDITITVRSEHPKGGQHVAMDRGIICARHEPSGVYVEVPGGWARSQRKAILAALEAIEYLTGARIDG